MQKCRRYIFILLKRASLVSKEKDQIYKYVHTTHDDQTRECKMQILHTNNDPSFNVETKT